jgi:hypothetical protein
MNKEGTFNIGYNHEFVEWVPEQPTEEYMHARHITGDLIVARLSDTSYFYCPRDDAASNERVIDQLEQGIQGFQGGWVIFRINGLPY